MSLLPVPTAILALSLQAIPDPAVEPPRQVLVVPPASPRVARIQQKVAITPEAEAAQVEATFQQLGPRLLAQNRANVARARQPILYRTASGLPLNIGFRPAEGGDNPSALRPFLEPSSFDGAAFGAAGATETQFVDQWKRRLNVAVEAAVAAHHLEPGEAARLRLAGCLDIKHLRDQLGEHRHAFDATGGDIRTGLLVLRTVGDLLRSKDDLFGEGSLFAKTLARIRDDRGR